MSSRPGANDEQRNVILVGDVRRRLAEIPAASVDAVITSPPYFQLRDYGAQGQIGLEGTVDEWVDELRLVMRGMSRVLKSSGSVWLNLGDTYSRHERYGAPPKSLLLGPERLGLALLEDGWTIRNRVAWAKSNNMPNPVRDRLSCTWEVVYFLTRHRRYFMDLDAIRVPHRSAQPKRRSSDAVVAASLNSRPQWAGPLAGSNSGLARMKAMGLVGHPLGKNPGDVWRLPASNYRGAHHATFPPGLVERPLLATCPERVCANCGQPWQRQPARRHRLLPKPGELQAGCACRVGWRPGLVLDPFFGAGTVGVVAEQLGRDWLGIEVNPAYARLAEERIAKARSDRNDQSRQRHAA